MSHIPCIPVPSGFLTKRQNLLWFLWKMPDRWAFAPIPNPPTNPQALASMPQPKRFFTADNRAQALAYIREMSIEAINQFLTLDHSPN